MQSGEMDMGRLRKKLRWMSVKRGWAEMEPLLTARAVLCWCCVAVPRVHSMCDDLCATASRMWAGVEPKRVPSATHRKGQQLRNQWLVERDSR